MNITLQPITEENFLDAFNLQLKKEQESFVSLGSISLPLSRFKVVYN